MIKRVETKADLKQFILFPWTIYKNDPNWVPPLIMDMEAILGKENPFWEHAEKELFLAYDAAGKIVGRVAGVIDHNYIKFHDELVGFFGFYDSLNDPAITVELLAAVRQWIKGRGLVIMRGPMNPSTNDECGFLCHGFNEPPCLMMPYNPEYYLKLVESAGLAKAKELYAYDMDVSSGPLKRLERIVQSVYKKLPGLTVRPINKKAFKEELGKALGVYNAAWEKNWGFVPWTTKEFFYIALKLKDLLFPDTALIAELDGQPVGILIAVPDYNFVLKKLNGRLFPLGFLKFLFYKDKIKALRLMIMGVVKEQRQRGIEGAMYYESLKNAQKAGFEHCEFSWILDDNTMTQRAAEMMGGKLYRRYRIYEAVL